MSINLIDLAFSVFILTNRKLTLTFDLDVNIYFMSNVKERMKRAEDAINEIQTYVTSIVYMYENLKQFFQADLNYFEDANKNILSLISSLTLLNDQNKGNTVFNDSTVEPVAFLINSLNPSFMIINKEINAILPKLKEQLSTSTKAAQQFTQKTTSIIYDIRKSVKTCFEKTNKDKQKQTLGAKGALELGSHLHHYYSDMYSDLISEQEKLRQLIIDADMFIGKQMKAEEEIISLGSSVIADTFPFKDIEKTIVPRIEKEKVADYHQKIKAAFFALFTATGPPKSNEKEIVPHVWSDLQGDKFKARVWENFTPRFEGEIEVSRKEIVTVERVTMQQHWEVKRSNGITGMVPAAFLEPLR
ncbi:hypothetical protein TRFO_29373 [Tritrichomonas foetus]|uniref:SH3 domain-containing protein n=1 Tax=Tritrichomonas foetus TaxID=1144522 RepID=A0A1J4JVX2_9EUKA|nr:hypothetical protein TRFO_29373 [Tritrichomonas foetus]|eukprot:OHT03281.1 hypothetical protein TRFO_29373 [Tritrichomonas foetus]